MTYLREFGLVLGALGAVSGVAVWIRMCWRRGKGVSDV
jgi:hypothetical protein